MAGMEELPGVGGGAPQVGGTLADEEAAMKSGKGRMLIAIIGTCVVVVVGAVLLLVQGESHEEFREAGKLVNGAGIKGNFDKFWGCALRNVDLRDLKNAEDLISQINMRGADGRARYAKYVEASCIEKLSDMQTKLDVLTVPQELQTNATGMKDAASQLRGAWSGYLVYLTDSKDSYDDGEARDKLKEVARGWYEFKKAHASLNNTLKEKLE